MRSRCGRGRRHGVYSQPNKRPAVILLDINMPMMDGPQFCAGLDATLGRKDIAIVLMTATGATARVQAAYGTDDRLGKPFGLDDLYAVVTRYFPSA